jgi:hypothetical protein
VAIDYAAMRSEIVTDPAGVGYAAPYAAGNDDGVAALLNAVGAGAAYSVYKKSVPVRDLVASIDPTNFAALTALQLAKLQLLFTGAATLDASDANTRTIVQGVFSGMAATLTNFAVLVKRQGSRAEVLWGDGARVSADDVSKARKA